MRLLIIGGTRFVGRTAAQLALERGHSLTLFNRGRTRGLFPGVEEIVGDRDQGLEGLEGREWDAVIDTCGYVPRQLAASTAALADRVGHYVFVSSISAYPDLSAPYMSEDSEVATTDQVDALAKDFSNYGGLKVLCERAATAGMGGRAANVRAGLIVGPWDNSDRFTWWVRYVGQGGERLAPEPRDAPLEFIDVRDLSTFMLDLAERRTAGTFNASGPGERPSFQALLQAIRDASGAPTRLCWLEEALLHEEQLTPWGDLPLWLGSSPMGVIDHTRAQAAGLRWRDWRQTVADTLAWDRSREGGLRAGISFERAAQVLEKARAQGRVTLEE